MCLAIVMLPQQNLYTPRIYCHLRKHVPFISLNTLTRHAGRSNHIHCSLNSENYQLFSVSLFHFLAKQNVNVALANSATQLLRRV